jgi:hypothetical protein
MSKYFGALFTITLILGLASTIAANAHPEQSISKTSCEPSLFDDVASTHKL